MKITKLFYLSVIGLVSSCAPTSFYQVYSVKSTQEIITTDDVLLIEDENCKISYNLWANGGNIGFDFYNKTNSEIYVNLNKSYFVLNGFANDYYKDRTYTSSKSNSASTSSTYGSSYAVTGVNTYNNIQTNQVKSSSSVNLNSAIGYAVATKEDSIVCIPAKTTKRISEYLISNVLIRNCDLLKYPKKREIKTKSYSVEQSPIVFSNRITYKVDGKINNIENSFFVSEITNYPSSDFFENKYIEYCGQKSYSTAKFYKFYDIDKFYIKYSKGTDTWKH